MIITNNERKDIRFFQNLGYKEPSGFNRLFLIIIFSLVHVISGISNDEPKQSLEFQYSGEEQILNVNSNITKLWIEAYGGRGGVKSGAGYGAKVSTVIDLSKLPNDWGNSLYINVGGNSQGLDGGYNGGGIGQVGNSGNGVGGGGASHIAISSGLLESFSANQSAVLLAAGGGGGLWVNQITLLREQQAMGMAVKLDRTDCGLFLKELMVWGLHKYMVAQLMKAKLGGVGQTAVLAKEGI